MSSNSKSSFQRRGSEVTITGESSVGALVTLATAEVKVEETAAVSNITVDGDVSDPEDGEVALAAVAAVDEGAAGDTSDADMDTDGSDF